MSDSGPNEERPDFVVRSTILEGYTRVDLDLQRKFAEGVGIGFGLFVDGELRAGDMGALETVDRDLTAVVYDAEAIDPSTITADYTASLVPGSMMVFFAIWRDSGAQRTDGFAVEIRLSAEREFAIGQQWVGEDAVGELRSRQIVLGSQVEFAPTPVQSASVFTTIEVSGLRGFATTHTLRLAAPTGEDGSGLTILVGANNSGKSTFLEALQYVARARLYSDLTFPQPRRHRDHDMVSLRLSRSDGRALEVASIQSGGSQAAVVWLPVNAQPTRFDVHVTPSRRSFNPYFGTGVTSDRNWGTMDQQLSRTDLRDQFVGRLRVADREPARRTKFNELLREIVGYDIEWTFDEIDSGQQFLKLIESDGAWHTSEGLGDGLVSLLFIVDALYDSDPSALIAIDEPELSLHPQLVRRLRRVLSRYAKDRQIVVATHSPHLVDWSDIAHGASIARVFKRDGKSEVAQASQTLLTEVARLAEDRNVRNPHTVGVAAREAFFLEDGVLLTEGQDDVAYLPRVLDDLGMDAIENIYGWGAGGVSNLPLIAKLFIELGFEHIGVLVDGDGQEQTKDAIDELKALAPKVVVASHPAPDIRYKPKVKERAAVEGLLEKDDRTVQPAMREAAKEALETLVAHIAR